MRKRKPVKGKEKDKEKEPQSLADDSGSDAVLDNSSTDNSNTDSPKNQEKLNIEDPEIAKTQEFQADEKSYKMPEDPSRSARHFTFIVYEDSAPATWREDLANTGLPFAVSPYHDRDVNFDHSAKKGHWHGILSYSNTTTYRNVAETIRKITHGPYPLICHSVAGMYAYFTHKWNPEKYQYDAKDIERFNGWSKVLESTEVGAIMDEMTMLIFSEDIREYAELVIEAKYIDGDHLDVVMSHTMYFDRLITSYWRNPIRSLKRLYGHLEDGELKDEIKDRIIEFESEVESYEGND